VGKSHAFIHGFLRGPAHKSSRHPKQKKSNCRRLQLRSACMYCTANTRTMAK
jgi:hypothetical protein